jgi:AcrR family transcriptional regulator
MNAARPRSPVSPVDLRQLLHRVQPPTPVLDREREARLTARQRELLQNLEQPFFAEGFANLTMAGLAARMQCSMRTLYALASSRNELVLVVVDRTLWRVGRAARDSVPPNGLPLAALRSYLRAATWAISEWTEPFARDLADIPAARELEHGHNEYLYEVTLTLLDAAVARGDIAHVDTVAVARVLAGLGRYFTRPEILPTLRTGPKAAADSLVDLVLAGLPSCSGKR